MGRIYEGTPAAIIKQAGEEMVRALEMTGNSPLSGVHVLALLQVVVSIIHQAKTDPNYGVMPSFSAMLMMLTHGLAQTTFTDDEINLFREEFDMIVASLGGGKLDKAHRHIMSPSLGVN